MSLFDDPADQPDDEANSERQLKDTLNSVHLSCERGGYLEVPNTLIHPDWGAVKKLLYQALVYGFSHSGTENSPATFYASALRFPGLTGIAFSEANEMHREKVVELLLWLCGLPQLDIQDYSNIKKLRERYLEAPSRVTSRSAEAGYVVSTSRITELRHEYDAYHYWYHTIRPQVSNTGYQWQAPWPGEYKPYVSRSVLEVVHGCDSKVPLMFALTAHGLNFQEIEKQLGNACFLNAAKKILGSRGYQQAKAVHLRQLSQWAASQALDRRPITTTLLTRELGLVWCLACWVSACDSLSMAGALDQVLNEAVIGEYSLSIAVLLLQQNARLEACGLTTGALNNADISNTAAVRFHQFVHTLNELKEKQYRVYLTPPEVTKARSTPVLELLDNLTFAQFTENRQGMTKRFDRVTAEKKAAAKAARETKPGKRSCQSLSPRFNVNQGLRKLNTEGLVKRVLPFIATYSRIDLMLEHFCPDIESQLAHYRSVVSEASSNPAAAALESTLDTFIAARCGAASTPEELCQSEEELLLQMAQILVINHFTPSHKESALVLLKQLCVRSAKLPVSLAGEDLIGLTPKQKRQKRQQIEDEAPLLDDDVAYLLRGIDGNNDEALTAEEIKRLGVRGLLTQFFDEHCQCAGGDEEKDALKNRLFEMMALVIAINPSEGPLIEAEELVENWLEAQAAWLRAKINQYDFAPSEHPRLRLKIARVWPSLEDDMQRLLQDIDKLNDLNALIR